MIVEALAHAGGHVTAEEIYAQVSDRVQTVNIATVYRTLDLLVATGLTSRIDLWDGRVVYTTAQHGPHIHLVCRCCGEIYSADHYLVDALDGQLRSLYNFQADLQHLSISGVCANCQNQTQP
jgi:Fur family ferric uptake transcriptional regulator